MTSSFQKKATVNFGRQVLEDEQLHQLNFQLGLSGPSFEIIQSDPVLLNHFIFIASFCKHIFGYNISPYQKAVLTNLIKKYFPNTPTVLSIGTGYTDTLLMQASDISVEVYDPQCSAAKNAQLVNAADITVSNIKCVSGLILNHGQTVYNQMMNFVRSLFYVNVLLIFPIFYFNWYTNFSATLLYEPLMQYYASSVLILPFFFLETFTRQDFKPQIMRKYPSLLIMGQFLKRLTIKKYLMHILIVPLTQSTVIYYATAYTIQQVQLQDGKNSDYQLFAFTVLLTILILVYVQQCITAVARKTQVLILAILFQIGLFALILLTQSANANNEQRLLKHKYQVLIQAIFSNKQIVLLIICNVVASLYCKFLIQYLVNYVIFPNIYNFYGKSLSSRAAKPTRHPKTPAHASSGSQRRASPAFKQGSSPAFKQGSWVAFGSTHLLSNRAAGWLSNKAAACACSCVGLAPWPSAGRQLWLPSNSRITARTAFAATAAAYSDKLSIKNTDIKKKFFQQFIKIDVGQIVKKIFRKTPQVEKPIQDSKPCTHLLSLPAQFSWSWRSLQPVSGGCASPPLSSANAIFCGAAFCPPTVLNPSTNNVTDLRLSPFSLEINDQKQEQQYKEEMKGYTLRVFRIMILFLVFSILLYTIYKFLEDESSVKYPLQRILIAVGSILIAAVALTRWINKHYNAIVFPIIFIAGLTFNVTIWFFSGLEVAIGTALFSYVITLNLNISIPKIIFTIIGTYVNFFIRIIYQYQVQSSGAYIDNDIYYNPEYNGKFYTITSFFVLVLFISLVSIFNLFQIEKINRVTYLELQNVQQNHDETENILSILVPQFVQQRLTEGNTALAMEQDDVAVLFADIIEFDSKHRLRHAAALPLVLILLVLLVLLAFLVLLALLVLFLLLALLVLPLLLVASTSQPLAGRPVRHRPAGEEEGRAVHGPALPRVRHAVHALRHPEDRDGGQDVHGCGRHRGVRDQRPGQPAQAAEGEAADHDGDADAQDCVQHFLRERRQEEELPAEDRHSQGQRDCGRDRIPQAAVFADRGHGQHGVARDLQVPGRAHPDQQAGARRRAQGEVVLHQGNDIPEGAERDGRLPCP